MSTHLDQAKQPVSSVLAGPYGHPFHPILVTIPIGAWACGLVFDIASHIVEKPGFLNQASEWLIGIGVVSAIAAAMIGFLDLIAIPSGTSAFRTGLLHMTLNLIVTGAYVANFLWRHGTYSDEAAVARGPLVLSVISFALLGASGYLGGKLAYRYGVRVAREADQSAGFRPGR